MWHRDDRDGEGEGEAVPSVGRPRGPLWRALQADNVLWEGQVLLVGAEVDLAARVIVTEHRIAFARGGDLVLDLPRSWLHPAPVVRPDGTLLLSIRADGDDGGDGASDGPERVPLRMRDGDPDTFHLLNLLGGADGRGRAAADGGGSGRPSVLPPLPEPARVAPRAAGPDSASPVATAPLPVSPLDPFGALASEDASSPPSVTVLEPVVRPAPPPAAIGRDRDWNLQPIRAMVPRARRRRRGWGLRLGGLLLLLSVAYVGIARVPSRPEGRALVDPPGATGTAGGPTAVGPLPRTPTDPAIAALTDAERTSLAVGVGGLDETATAEATATARPSPTPPATAEPSPTAAGVAATAPATATATADPTPPAIATTTTAAAAEPDPTATAAAAAEPDPTAPATAAPTRTATAAPTATATAPAAPTRTAEPSPAPTAVPTTAPTAPTATEVATALVPTPTSPPAPTAVPQTVVPPTATAPRPTAPPPTATAPAPTATDTAAVTDPSPARPAPSATAAAPPVPPTQAPSVGPDAAPDQVLAVGPLRFTVEAAQRGASLPEFLLPQTPDGDWVALILHARNVSDAPAELPLSDLRLRIGSAGEEIALDAGTGVVAAILGIDPAVGDDAALLLDPGQEQRLTPVFAVPADGETATLLIGDVALDLTSAIETARPIRDVDLVAEVAPPALLEAIVTGIVDGERIEVEAAGAPVEVRYLGVDAPSGNACYAAEAVAANAALVEGQTVWLERERADADILGSLLRDVWIDDGGGRVLVAARLAAEGAALPDRDAPNDRYAGVIAAAAASAEAAGAGLWGACPAAATDETTAALVAVRAFSFPPWQKREIERDPPA